jgi:flagellar basal-body rod protein FlgB
MAISELPIFSMLRTKMQWHQERQRLLAENVSNADTPHFKPRDLKEPEFDKPTPAAMVVGLARTDAGHIAGMGLSPPRFRADKAGGFETRPAGNAVALEDEMLKVAANQMDYQQASTLYMKSLGLLKTAIGKR